MPSSSGEMDDLGTGQRQVGTPQCSSSELRWGLRAGLGPEGVGGEHNELGREEIKGAGVQLQLEDLWKDQLLQSRACC